MVSFSKQYNLNNLKDAADCHGTPLSYISFVEIKEVSLNEILFMWTGSTVLDINEEDGLKFGWGFINS